MPPKALSYTHGLFLRYFKKKFLLIFSLLRREFQWSNIYSFFSAGKEEREGTRVSLQVGKNVKKKNKG